MTKRYRNRGQRALAVVSDATAPSVGRTAPTPQIIRYAPTNLYADLTFPQVLQFLQDADRGQTEQWADLTRRMLDDDHVASVKGTRIEAVAGAQWKLHPGDEVGGADDGLARRAVEDCTRILESLPALDRSFADILDGVFTGYSCLEIIWEPKGDEWRPVELIWLHPRRFRFAYNYELYLYDNGLASSYPGGTTDSAIGLNGLRLTPNKYIQHLPRTLANYPNSAGLLRAMVRAWWVKTWCMKFWLGGAEIAGNPRMWGKHPSSADIAVRDMLFAGLSNLSADGVGVFDSETSIEMQPPLAQGGGSVFETLVKRCDAAMSKVALGSTLNVEVGDSGGNRALGESQGDITIMPRLQSDQRGMWSTIGRDLLRPYLWFNRHRYGGAMPPVPRGESILYQEQIEIDDLIVRKGKVTGDELRASRGLEAWGKERGGDEPLPPEETAPAVLPFAAPEVAATTGPFAMKRPSVKWTAGMQAATRTSSR